MLTLCTNVPSPLSQSRRPASHAGPLCPATTAIVTPPGRHRPGGIGEEARAARRGRRRRRRAGRLWLQGALDDVPPLCGRERGQEARRTRRTSRRRRRRWRGRRAAGRAVGRAREDDAGAARGRERAVALDELAQRAHQRGAPRLQRAALRRRQDAAGLHHRARRLHPQADAAEAHRPRVDLLSSVQSLIA